MLDARGVLKLIDFTHAKAVVDDGDLSHLRSCGGGLSHLRSCGGLLSCAAQPCHRLFRRVRSAGNAVSTTQCTLRACGSSPTVGMVWCGGTVMRLGRYYRYSAGLGTPEYP